MNVQEQKLIFTLPTVCLKTGKGGDFSLSQRIEQYGTNNHFS